MPDLLLIYYFSLFELRYIFAQTISNSLLDKHSIHAKKDILSNSIFLLVISLWDTSFCRRGEKY